MTNRAPDSSRVASVIAAHGLLRVASGASAVLVGLVLATGSAPVAAVGAIGAAAFAAELLAAIPLGVLSDLRAPRPVMTAGAMLAFGGMLLATSGRLPALFAARTLEGLAAAAVVPALLAYLTAATATRPVLRVRAMSAFELTLLAGLAFGGIVAARLFTVLHAAAFAAVGLAYAVGAAVFALAVSGGSPSAAESPLGSLQRVLRLPALRRVAPVWLCVNAVVGLWLGPTLPFLLTHPSRAAQTLPGRYASNPTSVGLLLLAYAAVFACGVIAWSIVLPRVPLATAMTVALLAMLAASASIFVLNHADRVAPALRLAAGGFTIAAVLIESGFTPAALTWVARTLPPDSGRGAAMGVYSVLLGLGGIVGSVAAGVLGQAAAVDGLLFGTAIAGLVALVLVRRVAGFEALHPGAAA